MMREVTFAQAARSYTAQGGESKYLERIFERIGDRPVTSLYPGDFRQLAIELFPDGKNSTRNRHALTPCRAVMSHAYEMGWCHLMRIKALKLTKVRRHYPPDLAWLMTFLEFCDENRLPKLAALILFMNHTAARVSEAVDLMGEHVDLERRVAVLIRTKTELNSERHLSDELVRRIRMIGLRPGERVFGQNCRNNVNDRLRCVCRRAGIEYKSSHYVGRGAFATNALEMGVDVRTAMEAGGWSTPRMFLEVYARSRQAGSRMAARINQNFPAPRRDWLLN